MNPAEKKMRRRSPRSFKQYMTGAWEIIGMSGDGHVRLRHQSGRKLSVSASPSDHRTDLNTRARMRQIEAAHTDD